MLTRPPFLRLAEGTGASVALVKFDGNQLSGNFSLSFRGDSTGPVIPFNATAAEFKAHLESLNPIPTGALQVTRSGPDLQLGESLHPNRFHMPIAHGRGREGG